MCAIIGMVGRSAEGTWGRTHLVLTALLRAAERRGTDATGFVALTEPYGRKGDHGIAIDKQPMRGSRFVANSEPWLGLARRRSVAVVGHARWATCGDARLRLNAHPFSAECYHLVHNGCLSNHRDVAERFGLKLTTQVDSEVLLRLVELTRDPITGLDLCLRHVQGSMAVAMLDESEHRIWLLRRGRPLWLCRLRGERRWWFASTRQILSDGLKHGFGGSTEGRLDYLAPIPTETPISIDVDGVLLAHGEGG